MNKIYSHPFLMLFFLNRGLAMFARRIKILIFGLKKYRGSAENICSEIVDKCWNGVYYTTSLGHFKEFWTRDFGFCTDSLIAIGQIERVRATLQFALNKFSAYGAITTTIDRRGRTFNFPVGTIAPDTLAWFLYSLRQADAPGLISNYKDFLEREVKKYLSVIRDKKTGLIRKAVHFSSLKDHSVRSSSCYDNVMLFVILREAQQLGIYKEKKGPSAEMQLLNHFWNGRFFEDDISHAGHVCSDANLFPFYFGLVTAKNIMKEAFRSMEDAELDKSLPVKYSSGSKKVSNMIFEEIFAFGYERNTSWAHIGPLYIKLLAKLDKEKAKKHFESYRRSIEKNRTFLEVFYEDGRPFRSPFYYADEGMLWAVNYLTLCGELE